MIRTHFQNYGARRAAHAASTGFRGFTRSFGGGGNGQSLVELAFVLPVLVLLLIGAAEFGRLGYASIEVSNAARAGVAYGAQNHVTASETAEIETVAKNDAANFSEVSATATQLCACSNSPAATSTCSTTFSCSGTNRVVEYVQVTTTAAMNPLFHYPGQTFTTFTLTGHAIMRVEQ